MSSEIDHIGICGGWASAEEIGGIALMSFNYNLWEKEMRWRQEQIHQDLERSGQLWIGLLRILSAMAGQLQLKLKPLASALAGLTARGERSRPAGWGGAVHAPGTDAGPARGKQPATRAPAVRSGP